MPSRRESFNFLDLTSDRFEELVFLLGQLEVPGLVRTGNPDGGLDALVPADTSGRVPRGFQAKHHTGGPSITKCAKSLRDAIAAHNPEHVTFAFPTNPTVGQIAGFEEKVIAMASDVEVDWWGASQMTARLIGSDAGHRVARHIFGDDEFERLERLIRAHQKIDDGSQALEAMAASSNLLDSDPYFLYPTGSRPDGVPAPPPAKGTVMRVEITDADSARHIDAVPRPGAGQDQMPEGKFVLEGGEAIARWQKFLDEGGQVSFEDVAFEFEKLPKHLAPIWEGADRSDVVIRSEKRARIRILIEVDGDAGTFSAEVELVPAEPVEGWEHTVTGSVGEAELTINSRRRHEGAEAKVDWRWRAGGGSHRDQLRSLQFLRAASGKGTIRMLDPDSHELISQGPTPEASFDENLAALTRVYEDVIVFEDWLSTAIEVPEEILPSDANALRRIARLIEGIENGWTKASFAVDAEGPKEIEPEGVFQFRQEMAVELLGSRYELGELATYISAYRLDSSAPTSDGGTEFFLVPKDRSSRLLERLEPKR